LGNSEAPPWRIIAEQRPTYSCRQAITWLWSKAMDRFNTSATAADLARTDLARGGLAPWQVRTLNAHIDANLEGEISVEELAGLVRLSVSHFGRAFKQSFGRSPHAHVIAERIARAQDLMLGTAEPLAQIALTPWAWPTRATCRASFARHRREPFAWRRARWTPTQAGIALQ
jgi:transcriptional regulator GlxA family with amidase domain